MQVAKQFKPTKLTLLTIMLCSMLMLMGGAAVAPALPLIEQVFPGQDTLVSMIITIPSLAVALVGFAMGALADRLGKVKVLATSLVVFTAAGAVGFLMEGGSDTQLYILLVFRFVVGIGIAGISSAVTALIAEYYTGMDRIRALSYQSAAMGVGVLILEYTGGLLAEFSWREPFLVYLIGVPILLMVLLTMKEPRRDEQGPADRVVPERKANKRLLTICYVTIFVAMTMAFLLPTKMPTYLQTELAVSTSVTGLFLGVHGVTNACFSLMYRRFVQRFAPFTIIAIGFLLLAVALLTLEVSESIASSVVMMIVAGAGLGHRLDLRQDHGRVQHMPEPRPVLDLADQRPAVRRRRQLVSRDVRRDGRRRHRGLPGVRRHVQDRGQRRTRRRSLSRFRSWKWKSELVVPFWNNRTHSGQSSGTGP